MNSNRQRRLSFAWIAAGWVGLIAVLAAGGLFVLRRWHNRAAHQAAAQEVAERGQWLAMSLALRAAAVAEGSGEEDDAEAWRGFASLFRSLREMEEEIEYVAVRRGELTLFQQHAEAGGTAAEEDFHFQGPVEIRRKLLSVGEASVPVVTFTVSAGGARSEPVTLELGLRRRAVEREEQPAVEAIDSLYRLSLIIILVCFAICLALVAGMLRREERREAERRRNEHLAFSGMLANGIVHDFRNPMSSLRLDAQMLEKEIGRGPEVRLDRVAALAGRMRHTLDRMEKVFQEFLMLARPGEEAPVRLNLAACARECLDLLAPRLESSGIRAELRDESGGAAVRVAATAVKRALLNVLLNAIQHAGAGGRIAVEISRVGPRLRLDVCDSGPGIPPAEREKVFEMFYTTRPQGTGLGLFLARTAVEQSGGTLTVAEPAGAGARLRMEFPLAAPEKQEPA